MDPDRVETVVAVAILLVVLLSGPVGGLSPSGGPQRVGDGDADVVVQRAAGEDLEVTAGRFGTKGGYLRISDLVADVRSVTGRPELVYQVTVPELDLEARRRHVLGPDSTGTVRLSLDDRGLPSEALAAESYRGLVVVRVQSFSTERIVLNRSVAVPVHP